MKRLSILLILALLMSMLGGCRFAVVETDAVRVFAPSALAEESEETDEMLIGLHSRDEAGENRVRKLQQRLIDLGYLDAEADGAFGTRTLKALKRFQNDNGLDQTGVLDAETEALLIPQPDVTTPPDHVKFAQGDVSREVRMVRERLRQYGFSTRDSGWKLDEETFDEIAEFQTYAVRELGTEFDDPHAPVTMTPAPTLTESLALSGDFTADTPEPTATPDPTPVSDPLEFPEMPALEPVATLKPDHALDGVISEELWAYLNADRFPTYRETVQRNDEGEEVARVQRRLITLGYYYGEVDGRFDDLTIQALKCFQENNGIQMTGIANEETQRRLFAEDAVPEEEVDQPFYIKVSITEQRVFIYQWHKGEYSQLIKTMICSTGFGNSTPKGVFVSPGHRDSRWHYFSEFECWAQWAFVIKGKILFHSVIYSSCNESSLRTSTLYNLGRKASHGCVRLRVEDAKWIYDHCGAGQVIEIY